MYLRNFNSGTLHFAQICAMWCCQSQRKSMVATHTISIFRGRYIVKPYVRRKFRKVLKYLEMQFCLDVNKDCVFWDPPKIPTNQKIKIQVRVDEKNHWKTTPLESKQPCKKHTADRNVKPWARGDTEASINIPSWSKKCWWNKAHFTGNILPNLTKVLSQCLSMHS